MLRRGTTHRPSCVLWVVRSSFESVDKALQGSVMAKKTATTQEQGFLADIVANPADDTPRLVFADWLEDHGQTHRAEFIRLQCRLATMPEDDPHRLELEER